MRAALQMLTTILRLAALLVISTGAKGDLLLGGVSGADLHWSRIPVRSTVGAKSPTNSPPGAAFGAGSGIGACYDSMYACNVTSGVWKPKKNKSISARCYDAFCEENKRRKGGIVFIHVKGHSDKQRTTSQTLLGGRLLLTGCHTSMHVLHASM